MRAFHGCGSPGGTAVREGEEGGGSGQSSPESIVKNI